jgi:hypothetical protein
MWQVVSGTAKLLGECDVHAIVRSAAGDGRPHVTLQGMAAQKSE